jgi:hypothetical protein
MGIDAMPEEYVTSAREVQSEKTDQPIVVTLSGRTTDVSPVL